MHMKTYHVWMALLDNPNEWLYIPDIAFDANLTFAQVQSILGTFNIPELEKAKDSPRNVRLNIDDKRLKDLKRQVLMDYHKISTPMIEQIKGVLSDTGYMSITDVASETDLPLTKVSIALSIMDGTAMMEFDSKKMYALSR